ncbi:MAG: HDOD domain-containing protein [Pseudomonadota bacterium]
MTISKANKITGEQLLERMNEKGEFPAVLQHITEINLKTSPLSMTSANELASLVLKDFSLSSKLLKVVNSAMYRQFSGQISTVSRAVVILGFEQVRITATGLMFFANLQDKTTAQYVKEEVFSSFLTGILAQDLSKHLKMEDGEDLFICGMFHNFGRLLVMYCFPDKYEEYRQLVVEGELTDEIAMQKTLGTTFDELGMEVADLWNLPTLIITSMKMIPVQEIKDRNAKIDRQRKLVNFANELCSIRIDSLPEQRQEELRSVLKKYKASYNIPEKEIIKMMDSALSKMRDFADVLNLKQKDLSKLDQRSFRGQSELASVNTPEEQVRPSEAAVSLADFEISDGVPPSSASISIEDRQQLLSDAIQEITDAMLDDFTLDPLLTLILESVYRGLGFDQTLIFFRNPTTNIMQPRYGFGRNAKELLAEFSFPVQENSRDLFNMALAEGRDLYIDNISVADLTLRTPAWFRGMIFSPSFVIYPLIVNKRSTGLIYGAHISPEHHLEQRQLDALKTLRNQAALAIKLSSVNPVRERVFSRGR